MLNKLKSIFSKYLYWRRRNIGISLNRSLRYQGGFISWIPAIATVASAVIGGSASESAANTQANAANTASANQMGMFNTINTQQAPWRQAGATAIGQLGDLTTRPSTDPSSMLHQFGANDLNANLAPNYQFMLDQGLGAVKNQFNAAGGLIGGNALKGINDYAQNYAGNAYQNAFQNYTANQTNIFNRLSNIAGLGQTANQTTATAGQNAATASSNYLTSGAAAQAAGTVGAANALSSGTQNALGWNYLSNIGKTGPVSTDLSQYAAG
jgi:hypothetical protein